MRKFIPIASLVALTSFIAAPSSQAVTLANFDGTSFSSVASAVDNVTISNLTQGGNLSTFELSGGLYNAQPGNSSPVTSDTAVQRSNAAFDVGDFASFTITPSAGFKLNIDSFSFDGRKGGSSSRIIGIASSATNTFSTPANFNYLYAADPGTSIVNLISNNDPGAAFQGLDTLTFVFTLSGNNTLRLDNLVVGGSVVAVPAPASAAALLIGSLGVLVAIRRRRA